MGYQYQFTNHARERYVERIIQIRKSHVQKYIEVNRRKLDGIMGSDIKNAQVIDLAKLTPTIAAYYTGKYNSYFLKNNKNIFVIREEDGKKVLVTCFKTNGLIGDILYGW